MEDNIKDENGENKVVTKTSSVKRKVGITIFLVLFTVLVLPYILIHIPAVQNKIKDIAIGIVVKKTNSRIEIGHIYLKPFNRLSLSDVYVEDLSKDTLLFVENLEVKISPWRLLKSNLVLKKVLLSNFTANVYSKDNESDLNFMFLIDAFASDKQTEQDSVPSKFSVYLSRIELEKGKLSYNILSEKKEKGFNASHINITDLNAALTFKMIAPDSMYAKIENLSLRESSGLIVKNLAVEAFKKANNIDFVGLKLEMPNSNLEISKGRLVNYSDYSANITANIKPSDLAPFSDFLKDITTPLTLSGNVIGNMKSLELNRLKLKYGNSLSLAGDDKIKDFTNWETSKFRLNLSKVSLDKKYAKELTSLGLEESMLKMVPDNLEVMLIAEGTLPDFTTLVEVKSPDDDISINGKLGYNMDTKETFLDVFLDAKKINISRWVETDSTMPSVSSFTANIKGRIDKYGNPHLDTKINFKNLFFNNYNYKGIDIIFSYENNTLKSEIRSKDSLASLKLEANGTYIHNKKIDGNVKITIDSLYLSRLNYMDTAIDARVRGVITANAKGENFERIVFNSKITNLKFQTNKGSYSDSIEIYYASTDNLKKGNICSNFIDIFLDGQFTYDTLTKNVKSALASYYPSFVEGKFPYYTTNQYVNTRIYIKNTESISKTMDIPIVVKDTAIILLAHNNKEKIKAKLDANGINVSNNKIGNIAMLLKPLNDSILNLDIGADYFVPNDTLHVGLNIDSHDKETSIALRLKNEDESNNLEGNIVSYISLNEFDPLDVAINVKESVLKMYGHTFKVLPAEINISNKEVIIKNVGLVHSETDFLRVNGKLSPNAKDSLNVGIGNMRLELITSLMQLDLPLKGVINGEIQASHLFSTPRIFTRGFTINDIYLADSLIGDFKLSSLWSTEMQAIMLSSTLVKGDKKSTIAGIVKPQKDSIRLRVNINDFTLNTLTPMTKALTYELGGHLNTNISITGKISDPVIVGKIYFKNAEMGINKTLCKYYINDSINLENNLLSLKKFRISDHEKKDVIIDGTIKYNGIRKYEPKLNLSLDNFNVLNNSKHVDSLFFGKLRLTGNINVTGNEKDLRVNAAITNGRNSDIKINLPDNIGEASNYESVIFINNDSVEVDSIIKRGPFITGLLPIKLKTNLLISEDLKLGVVLNTSTRDIASVIGKGELDFTYDMSDGKMGLLGKYVVSEGNATISLKGITKKKFTVEPGGTVTFKGDPMATAFDVTAIHTVRTYLSSLDPSFENDVNVSTNKVRVDCALGVAGDINKMEITYNINLPNVNDDVRRKVEGLISTDEIKIKEVAYLLTLGSFYPPVSYEATSAASGNIWANLASSSLTNQLNNLLSGVLKENWTIGTNFSADDDYSNLDMDVSVSTKLLNNRLTINTNLGMRSSSTTKNTFVGDFDAQYKLTKSGTWLINAYNVTNDQYYKQAPTTQGVGVMYQKSGKTFKDLFKGIIQRFQRREKDEENEQEQKKVKPDLGE